MTFSEDENPRGYNTGLLDFFPGEGEEVPATGFTPKHEQLELTEGSLPLNRGTLAVGDDIMFVLVGGDIRPHVIDALQALVGTIKNECVVEQEVY